MAAITPDKSSGRLDVVVVGSSSSLRAGLYYFSERICAPTRGVSCFSYAFFSFVREVAAAAAYISSSPVAASASEYCVT